MGCPSHFDILFNNQQPDHVYFKDEPVLCMSRQQLVDSVQNFLSHFPGTTLYAVKCNPHSAVITALVELGITHFDTASLAEIQFVKSISPAAKCYFNHPIKTRGAIYAAYYNYGVRDFVIDSREEWEKLMGEIPVEDITVQFRIDAETGSKTYDFSQKFGMRPQDVPVLATELLSKGIDWALSFHVGSQCEDPYAFSKALKSCQEIIENVEKKPAYVNVGGGFPGNYPHSNVPRLQNYFDQMTQMKNKFHLPPLLCEPGRALVCHAGALIVQILARKQDRLYLNDGVYGALGEVNYARLRLNTRAVSAHRQLNHHHREFVIFGPTCDSFDTLEQKFQLPDNVDEGDWIVIFDLGAYSTALSSQFNGFKSDTVHFLN